MIGSYVMSALNSEMKTSRENFEYLKENLKNAEEKIESEKPNNEKKLEKFYRIRNKFSQIVTSQNSVYWDIDELIASKKRGEDDAKANWGRFELQIEREYAKFKANFQQLRTVYVNINDLLGQKWHTKHFFTLELIPEGKSVNSPDVAWPKFHQ